MDPSTYESAMATGGIPPPPQVHSAGHSSGSSLSNQMVLLQNFWQSQLHAIDHGELDFKNFQLPLARIKKVMKTDEDVKMISAEAPIIFAKACEIFILELTLRAWLHTEDSKRRTLQRSDVSAAVQKTDTFDFLIDIVPREDSRSMAKRLENDYRGSLLGDPSFYLPSQLALQQQLQMHNPYAPGGGMPMPGSGAPPGSAMDQILYYQQQAQQQQQQQQLQQQQQQLQQQQIQMQMMHHRHQIQQTEPPPTTELMLAKDYPSSGGDIRNSSNPNLSSQLPPTSNS